MMVYMAHAYLDAGMHHWDMNWMSTDPPLLAACLVDRLEAVAKQPRFFALELLSRQNS